ncbi:MAG: M28 family peptidase, partial [Terriglobia bacterium]
MVMCLSQHSFSPISRWLMPAVLAILFAAGAAVAQDPVPQAAPPRPKLLPPPAGAIILREVSKSDLRATIKGLVSCGTRHSLSSWTDPLRGIGCGRDHIVAEFKKIAAGSGGRLRVVVDRFEVKAPRTGNKLVPMENVYAILPGDDPALAKTVFVVSGHFDSMPSNIMDPKSDAPGADDDGSGTAVSIECARLLARGHFRATLVFATVSGEEQGLLGGTRLLHYLEQRGYTVGGMLDNDIVGADFAPGAPHRVRLFSGNGKVDDGDSPSRELARRVEEIDGRHNIRLIFRLDRLGRGGDHRPFVEAGLPAVRFTE